MQQQAIMDNYRSHRIYKPQLIRPATWTCDKAQDKRRWRHESWFVAWAKRAVLAMTFICTTCAELVESQDKSRLRSGEGKWQN